MTNRPLVFFGTEAFSATSLERLIEHGFTIAAIVTKPDRARGRGRKVESSAIKTLAEAHRLPLLQPERYDDETVACLRDLGVTAGVVVAYGKIIPQAAIDVFSDGLINVHASLLPKYRGAAPIEAAILNGDAETGVTLMRIEAGLDSGPTFAAVPKPLSGRETRPELYESLARLGADLLVEHLSAILDKRLAPITQDATKATHVAMITKAQSTLDCARPAIELERQVRAYLGWPGSRLELGDQMVTVTAAHVGDTLPFTDAKGTGATPCTPFVTNRNELAVVTCEGELIIDRLVPPGKREMTGQAYLAGHPLR